MKKFFYFSIFLFPIFAFAFTVPGKPTTLVNDFAGVLSSDQISALESKLSAYEKQSTNEIAVVTIKSLDGDSIENVAQNIFTEWGIGKKDKNNGVLFLIAIEDRQTRIHTGYGVEGDLTDIGTSYIQRDIVTPAFRAGDYAGGINGAVDKMIEALGGTQIVPENYKPETSKKSGINWEFILVAGFIIVQWLIAILAKSKSWWGGGVIGGVIALAIIWSVGVFSFSAIGIFIGLVLFGLFFDYLVSKAYQEHKDTGGRPPWFLGGGGFGGGGSSGGGGFGGFGGGSSGGGGSSNSW